MNRISFRDDYYFTLGVKETATPEEIRDAYRALMKLYHPDLNEDHARANERGKRINEAYEVLSDPKIRADYDNWVNGTNATSSPQHNAAGVKQDDVESNKGQSSGSWYREEAVRRKAQQVRRSGSQLRDVDVLEQWFRQQNLLRRLLTPKDFLLAMQGQGSEFFSCLRATTDFLDKQTSFRTDDLTMNVWAHNEARIRSTSNKLNYIPTEFSDEHVEIFEHATQVPCVACRGRGYIACPPRERCSPTQRCGRCGGDGTIFVSCTRCGGSGQTTLRRNCNRCKGSGWITDFDPCNQCWEGRITYKRPCSACTGRGGRRSMCARCDGQGRVKCSRCKGTGSVTCRRCNGTGRLDCTKCATHGRLMQVRFRIHDFKKRSLARFASEGRHTNNFEQGLRNGLVEKDFAGFGGELIQEDEQRPESPEVVRQRRCIEGFAVSSYQFQYGKKEVTVNQINGAGRNNKLSAPVSLPISLRRLSIAVIGGLALLIGAIMLLGILAG